MADHAAGDREHPAELGGDAADDEGDDGRALGADVVAGGVGHGASLAATTKLPLPFLGFLSLTTIRVWLPSFVNKT